MGKRWELGDRRRECKPGSIAILKVFLFSLGLFAIQACNPDQPASTVDSTKTATSNGAADQDVPLKSLSVTPPNSPVPKQIADSIWDGDYIEKYPNGIIKKRGYIKGGLASGEWLTFYEDGKPYSRGTYRNGYRVGYGVSWYHDGQMSSEGYYNLGTMVGKWKYWSEQGHNLVEKDYGGVMPDTANMK